MKTYVTHDSLIYDHQAAVHELVQVINRNTEELREDLNRAGLQVRTKDVRGGYSAE